MSLTPVDETVYLISDPKKTKMTRFSATEIDINLPTNDDNLYPLRKMLDLDSKSIDNLHKFSREGDADRLRELIKSNKTKFSKYVNILDTEKMAPLHYAARFNHIDCIKLLVEFGGADINITNEEKANAIHFAARYKRKSNKNDDADGAVKNFENIRRNKSQEIEKRMKEEDAKPTKENSVILYLVSKGGQPNAQDMYGCTPLHYAAMRGNEVAAFQLLMLKEVNTEVEDNESMTPLHLACAHNQDSIAEMLLGRKANLFNREESGQIPFHIVCTEGSMRLAKLLVEMAEKRNVLSKMLNAVDNERYTPLHYAVENAHVKIVQLCINKGADPNAITQDEKTSLHMASHCGSVELVKMIASAGASLDVNDNIDQTPMHVAAERNHVSVIKYLIAEGADMECRDKDSYTPLLIAAAYGHPEVIKLLMSKECNMFATDKENKNALYLAVEQSNPQAVNALLSEDMNHELLNIPDLQSNYPLHIACKIGKEEIVKILLNSGADDDVKNEEEQTPFHLAAKYGRMHIIKMLCELSQETLIMDEDEDSNTPLHLAAESGFAKVVQLLLDNGADIDARNCNRWTALDCAAAKGHLKVVQVLLKNDSPVDPMDKSKITPLYLACKNGHDKIVKLLLENGANIAQRVAGEDSENGCNALDAAIDNGYRDCALAILNCPNWELAMRNQTFSDKDTVNTPMRKLIRKMPDIAEVVFNKCSVVNSKNVHSEDFSITYNLEFLEDSYASWGLHENEDSQPARKNSLYKNHQHLQMVDIEPESSKLSKDMDSLETYDENGLLLSSAVPYISNKWKIQDNHPLMIMVKSERENLLVHPLVTNILNFKWKNFGQIVYYINLLIFMFFLFTLLAYMLEASAPYSFYLKNNAISSHISTCKGVKALFPNEKLKESAEICKYIIMALSVFGILKEIVQIFLKGTSYFNFENLMEWALYILAFITVFNFTECQRDIGIREPWQWQTGVVACFISIINLVLFIRKTPFFGIFVVMMTDVTWTFVKFLPLFFLFIFAFAFAFYLLLSNQTAFKNLPNSMIRTAIMTIGEFDFDTVFNSQFDSDDPKNKVMYDGVTYTIFVIFVIAMSIIIMNLLVGLAVDDIKAVQDKATLKRLAMQVTLALDVEGLAPELLRRRYIHRTVTVYPNRTYFVRFKRFLGIDESVPYIPGSDENLDDWEKIEVQQKQNLEQLKTVKHKVKNLQEQNQMLVNMLTKIMEHLKIQIDEDELNDMEDM